MEQRVYKGVVSPEELADYLVQQFDPQGLIGLLVTPCALFALLWPVSDLIGSATLPGPIRDAVDLFAGSRGIVLADPRELAHPHAR